MDWTKIALNILIVGVAAYSGAVGTGADMPHAVGTAVTAIVAALAGLVQKQPHQG